MRRPTPAPPDLVERNLEHTPRYWMLLTPDEAHELAARRVPDQVQQMAQWLAEDHPPLTEEA
jgi:hypothetical protein